MGVETDRLEKFRGLDDEGKSRQAVFGAYGAQDVEDDVLERAGTPGRVREHRHPGHGRGAHGDSAERPAEVRRLRAYATDVVERRREGVEPERGVVARRRVGMEHEGRRRAPLEPGKAGDAGSRLAEGTLPGGRYRGPEDETRAAGASGDPLGACDTIGRQQLG